jgi:NAD(P)H-dependent flavin oxidoreductase YrpB (nitropropane dioxygenase family)
VPYTPKQKSPTQSHRQLFAASMSAAGLFEDRSERLQILWAQRTDKPFGVNHLLFRIREDMFSVTLRANPTVAAFAWARKDPNLRDSFQPAHDAGCGQVHCREVPEAVRAAEIGVDVLVAQGTEAGGHVGWMAALPLVPIIVKMVAPLPVLPAGGIADGRGLAAALALGAEGVLLGTRFMATPEASIHGNYKQAIVKTDGHDTVLTEIPDLASHASGWAMSRAQRDKFIERWSGREWAIRQDATEVGNQVAAARAAGDVDNAPLSFGEDAGLIDSIKTVKEVIEDIIAEVGKIIAGRLPSLLRRPT